jgi:hypothetical protein
MSLASIELPTGLLLVTVGAVFGASHWLDSIQSGIATPAGTVMASALPVILGTQLILAFLGHDIQSVPKRPLHPTKKAEKKATR